MYCREKKPCLGNGRFSVSASASFSDVRNIAAFGLDERKKLYSQALLLLVSRPLAYLFLRHGRQELGLYLISLTREHDVDGKQTIMCFSCSVTRCRKQRRLIAKHSLPSETLCLDPEIPQRDI